MPVTQPVHAVDNGGAPDDNGKQVTFNPTSPGTPTPTPTIIDSASGLSGVACPSTGQCTAVDNDGQEVTFDPTSPGTPTPTTIDSDGLYGASTGEANVMTGVACPSTSQCTAVDWTGQQVTFDPLSPGTPTPTMIDGSNHLNGVACPSTSQCTAVDTVGNVVTFDPLSPGTPTPTPIDSTNELYAVACASAGLCVAVDGFGDGFVGQGSAVAPPANTSPPTISGSVVQGQTLTEGHGSWTNTPTGFSYQWEDCNGSGSACSAIAGATGQTYALTASDVGHTIRVQETASNAGGSSSPASSAATGVVNGPTSPPRPAGPGPAISGSVVQGQTLTEGHGSWTNSPTGFSYQWEDCNGSGSACSEIAGATGQTYTLRVSDVGHTIRVGETATNAGGTGGPVDSAATGVVQARGGAPTLTVGHSNTTGTTTSVSIACTGPAGSSCTITLTLTAIETLKGGKVIAITAKSTKTRKKVVVLCSARESIAAGHS